MGFTLPTSWSESLAVTLLQTALRHHRLSHAYAWLGQDTAMLYQTALWLAALLNCQQAEQTGQNLTPCGQCRPCRWILQNAHPEVITISPVTFLEENSKKKTAVIDVGQAERLIHQLSTVSTDGWRVVIFTHGAVNEGDFSNTTSACMPSDAGVFPAPGGWNHGDSMGFKPSPLHQGTLKVDVANRLLKTFEEPGPRTLFLFLTDAPQGLLPTIASRCQFLRFPSGPLPQASSILSHEDPENEINSAMQALIQGIVAHEKPLSRLDPEWTAMQWVKSFESSQKAREQADKLLLSLQKSLWQAHRQQFQGFGEVQDTLGHIELAKRQIHANVSPDAVLGGLFTMLASIHDPVEESVSFPRLSLAALDTL